MDKENLISRFFTYEDEKETNIMWELHSMWWSRFYEYIWASKFINEDDIVLDSACGICHPFKFYLVDKCKKVYACDIDNRVLDKNAILEDIKFSLGENILNNFDHSYIDKIEFVCCDLSKTPYKDNTFDKITCVSVLEHLPEEVRREAFKEFSRILKNKGMLILTLDYPDVYPNKIIEYAKEFNFKFAGEFNFEIPDNAIQTDYFGGILKCFRVVLIKE